jgi:hypothetical protein
MHDWRTIVRQRIRVLKAASPAFAEAVTQELADHLEDRHEELLRRGFNEPDAFQCTLAELDARRQRMALQLLKENIMTNFARKVGLPGLFTFAAAMIAAWALEFAHVAPKMIFLSNGLTQPVPVAWVCLLPLCGALGVFLSRHAGGSRVDRLMAAGFPAIVMGTVLLLILAAGFLTSLFVRDSGWNWALAAPGLALWFGGYAGLTGIALLLGGVAAEQIGARSQNTAHEERA